MTESTDTTIFGRDREIAEIAAALESPAVSGVVIEGEQGMGKTRLAARVHADRGGTEIWIRGDRVLETVPFGAFGLIVDLDEDPETVLSRVVAALTAGSGTPSSSPTMPITSTRPAWRHCGILPVTERSGSSQR